MDPIIRSAASRNHREPLIAAIGKIRFEGSGGPDRG